MKHGLLGVFIVLLFISGTAMAVSDLMVNSKNIDPAEMNKYKDQFRDFFDSEVVKQLFGNERMNIIIIKNDNSRVLFGVITQNNEITEIIEPIIGNPTVNITATEDALLNINAAYFDRQEELQKQLDSGAIKYEPVGIFSSLKFGVLGLLNSLFRIFTPKPTVTDICYSTDKDNVNEAGLSIKGSTKFNDECLNDRLLKEYYCKNGDVTSKIHSCNCSEGACT